MYGFALFTESMVVQTVCCRLSSYLVSEMGAQLHVRMEYKRMVGVVVYGNGLKV